MEVVWWLHIQSGLPDDTDVLKYLGVLTIYIYVCVCVCVCVRVRVLCICWSGQ